MKSRIGFRSIATALLLFLCCINVSVHAQVAATTSNPGEYAAIIEGEGNIETNIAEQAKTSTLISAEAFTQLGMNTKMKNWQRKYNAYLKAAEFGNKIAAASSIYAEGISILRSLWDIEVACRINPEGIGAAIPMTNLYIETACQFVETYRTLKSIVKQDGTNSGNENMSNGAERVRMLWQLTADLEALNNNLHSLSRAILMFTFEDVWNAAISGMIEKDHKTLAEEAQKRAMRAMTNVAEFYRYKGKHKKSWTDKLVWD